MLVHPKAIGGEGVLAMPASWTGAPRCTPVGLRQQVAGRCKILMISYDNVSRTFGLAGSSDCMPLGRLSIRRASG